MCRMRRPSLLLLCAQPIFLVGAKMDLRDSEEAGSDVQSRTMDLQARMEPIMQEHEVRGAPWAVRAASDGSPRARRSPRASRPAWSALPARCTASQTCLPPPPASSCTPCGRSLTSRPWFALPPCAALFSPRGSPPAQRITSRYRNALDRVFRVFDEDNDGLLSEDEVCKFQVSRHATPRDQSPSPAHPCTCHALVAWVWG